MCGCIWVCVWCVQVGGVCCGFMWMCGLYVVVFVSLYVFGNGGEVCGVSVYRCVG